MDFIQNVVDNYCDVSYWLDVFGWTWVMSDGMDVAREYVILSEKD